MLKTNSSTIRSKVNVLFLKATAAVVLQKAVAAITFGRFVIFKDLTDSFTASEQISKQMVKSVADTFSVVDVTALGVTKHFTNSLSTAETAIFSVGLVKSDAATLGDTNVLVFSKSLSDSSGATDLAFSHTLTKVLGGIDFRAKNLESLENLEKNSMDFYASIRSLYLQDRQQKISNSKAVTDTQDDGDWEEIESQ